MLAASASTQPAHIVAGDSATNDLFGGAVAAAGTHLIAGAPGHGVFGYLAGAAYAFEHDGAAWQQVQKFDPPVHEPYGEFGTAVAMQGDEAAIGWIGAMEGDDRIGKVVLYEWAGGQWVQAHLLTDPAPEQGDRFGTSIDFDGDQLIVGCQLDDEAALNAGSGVVYRRIDGEWTFEARLVPAQGDEFTWAGRDVAIDGDIAAIGAYREWNGDIQAAGAAYVFARDAGGTWTQEARLTAADPYPGNYFGYSLSLDGERLAVGSILNDAPIEDSGAVYMFDRSGGDWPQYKLSPPDVGGEFSYAIAMRGVDLLVGSVYHAGPGFATGAVYRFEWVADQWVWRGKWLPLAGTDDCFFGSCIAINGAQAVVGAPREDTAGPWSGAVYVEQLHSDCPADITGDVQVGVNDLLAVVDSWGPCDGCPADIDGTGHVGADDLLTVIADWGWCH